ncbi:UDP-glucose 4-epimerase GalE [Microvirga antarctica]|uniref:UDP-glucose 4-epimerase GalE n=1 Tax=Microvirga antarctica TaxID=2819233 RepID=UPI001B305A2D|nr:UDP-glucose 4-epimerase GalE [Microvirga antarctica]
MPVLVTGGAGYIGSHIVLELTDSGESVVVLDDLSTGYPQTFPSGAVTFVRGDVGDAALLDSLFARHGIDGIIHCAAKAVVPESLVDPLAYYLTNTAKTRTLVAAALAAGVENLVFSSTAAVYGHGDGDLLAEDLPVFPINPYGRSKVATEWMLEDVSRAHGLHIAILRYFNVAGADPLGRAGQSSPQATHLIKAAVQAVLGLRPGLDLYGTDYETPDGTCIRDYVQVTDVARAHRVALDHLRGGGDNLTINCGYGHGTSVREVIAVVKQVSGVDFPVRIRERRGGDPARLVARVDRLRTLGWTPDHDDLAGMVSQALAWERILEERKVA